VATFSNNLGLKLNAPTDPFLLSDFIANWNILDANPGIFITTSTSRPSYTSSQAGRLIFLTDLKQFQWWNGTSWITDALYAPPVFHGGVDFGTSMARGTSPTFTCLTFSISRPCSVGIVLTAEYAIAAKQYQEFYQSVVFDGAQVATGFREHTILSAENINHPAYGALQSVCAIQTVAAGTHTVGALVQVQSTTSASVTIDGCKAIVWCSNYTSSNSF
jgi:hypothetical protein